MELLHTIFIYNELVNQGNSENCKDFNLILARGLC